MQKLMALLLTLTAVLCFAMPALADDAEGEGTTPPAASTHTITIHFEKSGHVYEAYQVFTGDYYDGKLSTIHWGSGVKGNELLAALKDAGFANAADFENASTASDVAEVLAGYTGKDASDKLDAFATVVGKYLTDTKSASTEAGSDGKYVYTIQVPSDGYYFVKDKNSVDDKNDANTKYILQVLNTATLNAKADVPDITKNIVNADGTAPRVQGDYNVGDTVYFQLESAVPDMDGYSSYTFTVTDTLSSGLTYTDGSVTVTIGDEEYKDFEATLDADKNVLTIDFPKILDEKDREDKAIVINYSAVLNKNALEKDRETNTVHLTYSNDPNSTGTGKTTDKKTYVHSFDIDIYKHDVADGEEHKTPLQGAQFVLYREVPNTEDNTTSREYYRYTDTGDGKVEWISQSDTSADALLTAAKNGKITSQTTDKDGKTAFTGLEAGQYHLQEIKAPDGYSLPDGDDAVTDVEIIVEYNEDGSIKSTVSNVKGETGKHMYVNAVITNKPGAVLPSTGGIGTTIFYVLGGVLTVAAIVLLIVKKRMENNQH